MTYKNYYDVEEGTEKYNVIKELHIDAMINMCLVLKNNTTIKRTYHTMATNYLLNIGLTQEQIDTLQAKLSH